jgi:hypothetical protein
VSEVFDDRNIALHGANDYYSETDAGRHEMRADNVILALIGWLIRTNSTEFADLDAQIAAMPKEPAPY